MDNEIYHFSTVRVLFHPQIQNRACSSVNQCSVIVLYEHSSSINWFAKDKAVRKTDLVIALLAEQKYYFAVSIVLDTNGLRVQTVMLIKGQRKKSLERCYQTKTLSRESENKQPRKI